jgi:hypothetical protein
MSGYQNAGRNNNLLIANKCFKIVAEFRSSGMAVKNQNYIYKEIKGSLNLGNTCYNLVQNFLSFCLLSKKFRIKTYGSIMLPVFLYECETWFHTLREEHRLRLFENRVLRSFITFALE